MAASCGWQGKGSSEHQPWEVGLVLLLVLLLLLVQMCCRARDAKSQGLQYMLVD